MYHLCRLVCGALGCLLAATASYAASQSNTGQLLLSSYYTAVATNAATSCTISDVGAGGCAASANGDCGALILFTSATAVTVTLPNTVPAGCAVALQQTTAAGTVTIASSMTSHSYLSMSHTAGQYAILIGMVLTTGSIYTVYGQGL